MTRPGMSIVRRAAQLFGDDLARRVFEPLVADWQREWMAGATPFARWVAWLRGYRALAVCTVVVGVRAAMPQPQDLPLLRRSAAVAAVFITGGAALWLLPFASWWISRGAAFGRLVPYLLPAVLAFALLFALVPAAMALGARAASSNLWRVRAALAALAAAAVLVLALLLGWGVPRAQQGWRESFTRSALPTAPRVLTLSELRVLSLGATTGPGYAATEWRRRATMAGVWPPVLLFLGWRLGRHRRSSGAVRLTFWWAFTIALEFAFQPTLPALTALQAMGPFKAPEFTAAAVWLLIAVALRPRIAAELEPEK